MDALKYCIYLLNPSSLVDLNTKGYKRIIFAGRFGIAPVFSKLLGTILPPKVQFKYTA